MDRLRHLSRRATRLLTTGMAAMVIASAAAATRPLTITIGSDVTSLDPHFPHTAINHATADQTVAPNGLFSGDARIAQAMRIRPAQP